MSAASGLTAVGQVAVDVRDLDRAVAFYRDRLGMKFLFAVPSMAFFDLSGLRLLLNQVTDTDDQRSSVLYYKVDDLDTSFQDLSGRGVQFSGEPAKIADMEDHQLWMAFFNDSEENTLALMAQRPLD
jgi:predicted enzyme related to lactoylglutathione lyase